MAMTINPAVSRVGYRRWLLHLTAFVLGVIVGSLTTYAVAHAAYRLLGLLWPHAWLFVAFLAVGLAALRDLGVGAPVPYPHGRQVPEWLRRVLPPGPAAFLYGGELGAGFLTRFTYSTHTAFVALLASQANAAVVLSSTAAFALGKSVVLLTSLAPISDLIR
jgi:hypothetical protein